MELVFRTIDESEPGPKWQRLFEEFGPDYERWYLREGNRARPRYAECRRMLHRHMPEFVPIWEQLCELAGGGDIAARILSLYRPPPFIAGCSQAIWSRDEVALVRNYDYAPHLCDGVILRSAWSGVTSIGTTDCLVGVLDGMNEHGLAVALAFGGRKEQGDGFGIPIVLRYILEFCATTADAVAALRRVPMHMTYTVAIVDRAGRSATVFVAPDRDAMLVERPVSTNHQLCVEWPEHGRVSQTVRREERLREHFDDPELDLEGLTARFLRPPLYQRTWARGSGTLYTLVCHPQHDCLVYRWPDHAWTLGINAFDERRHVARYVAHEASPPPVAR